MKTLKKTTVPPWMVNILVILLFTSSCKFLDDENPWIIKDPKNKQTTYYGPAVTVGNGQAKTFITLNREKIPTAIGIALSEKALENLPSDHNGHEGPISFENILELPMQAAITPFQFITLDWNPMGHEPAEVYDLPHFDLHFYMISNEDRMTITPLAPDVMDPEIPMAKYLPEIYIQTPGRVPNMGVHWVDPTSSELNGAIFDRTFIYGTYQDKVAFIEPMFTLDYIKSKPENVDTIKLPESFQIDGYYPSKYEIKYFPKKKEYHIILTDFFMNMAD